MALYNNAGKIWKFLKEKGFNDFACAGIIGNMDAESGLNPMNLQDSYQGRLGMDDISYTEAVDNGTYTKEQFVNDSAGYSLCQWTYGPRKRALYEFAKTTGRSVGDLYCALGFFYDEITSRFASVLAKLKAADSVYEATRVMMVGYECPYDTSPAAIDRRVGIAQVYFNRFANNTGGVISMGYYTCKKGQASKLSEFFNSTEMDCHGRGCCSETLINKKLVEYLSKIRAHFGQPITITSGYRCPVHNRNVGGATGSRHGKGDAADIVVKGTAPRTVAQYAESIGIKGIGLYETSSDGHFVHIDTRDVKSFWYGQRQEYRSTFGAYNGSQSGGSTGGNIAPPIQQDDLLNFGDKGEAVRVLQRQLIDLGYSCGVYGADGHYGNGTVKAVKAFQEKNGLPADGIVGYQTRKALETATSELNNQTAMAKVVITASALNVRTGPGTENPSIASVRRGTVCELMEERNGWCRLKKPNGWVSMEYCRRL